MYILTSEEMRRVDRHTIEQIGLPSAALMENAGRALAEETLTIAKTIQKAGADKPINQQRWLILVGKGNNGGDGLIASRHLQAAGITSDVLLMQPNELTDDAALQYSIIKQMKQRILVHGEDTIIWEDYDGIIDALLGTGTVGAPKAPYAAVIQEANRSGLPILSADIPSGLDADTGVVYEPCVRALVTVAFGFLKIGLLQYPGADFAGDVRVRSIGIPNELPEELNMHTRLLTPQVLEDLGIDISRKREMDTHKGTYGHVLVAAGTQRMSGAGFLTTRAALRTGAGLVTWAVPASLARHLIGRLPEAMLAGMPDAGDGDWTHVSAAALLALAEDRDAFAIGPGLGRYTDDSQWLRAIWEGVPCPLVIDADALSMLADAEDLSAWPKRAEATVLTPHPGEMARLAGVTTVEIQQNRIHAARAYASQYGVTLVLKGARTLIAAPDGQVYMNPTGNPGMATGGAGDVLTGIIASLLAQGLNGTQAACFGVWLHGLAGDAAANKRSSSASLIAGDIIEEL